MHRPSYEDVIDEMVSALAESRRARIERQAAYVALAKAILADNAVDGRDFLDFENPHAA